MREPLARRVAQAAPALTLTLLVIATISFVAAQATPRALFLVFGALSIAAVIWPLHRVRTVGDLLSPWLFVAASVIIAVGMRMIYITFGLADAAVLNSIFFLNQPPEYFVYPALLFIAALMLTSLGYFGGPTERLLASRVRTPGRFARVLRYYRFNARALHVTVAVFALIGFASFVLFAVQSGGIDLLAPSRKRATSPGLDPSEEFRGLGYLRLGASLGATAFLALLTHYVVTLRRVGLARSILLAGLFLNACLLPFYASSRGSITSMIILAATIPLLAGRRIRALHVGAALLAILALVSAMGVLRAQGDVGALSDHAWGRSLVDSVVVSRNLVDLTKTAHVVNNVPEVLEYQYGMTIAAWALAPIPRELWPEKPTIQAGPQVGVLVYGTSRAGVPPGFVGEMYWNFHIPGVLVGSVIFGLGLRILHEKFRPGLTRNPALILLYAVAIMRLGMNGLGSSVGQTVFGAAEEATLVLVLLWFSGVRRPGQPRWKWPMAKDPRRVRSRAISA